MSLQITALAHPSPTIFLQSQVVAVAGAKKRAWHTHTHTRTDRLADRSKQNLRSWHKHKKGLNSRSLFVRATRYIRRTTNYCYYLAGGFKFCMVCRSYKQGVPENRAMYLLLDRLTFASTYFILGTLLIR